MSTLVDMTSSAIVAELETEANMDLSDIAEASHVPLQYLASVKAKRKVCNLPVMYRSISFRAQQKRLLSITHGLTLGNRS